MGSQRMALRVGIDLRLFHILVEEDGTAISAVELAQRCKAETLIISTCYLPASLSHHSPLRLIFMTLVRIMRVITAIGFAAEAGPQSYLATPLTKSITKPALEAAAKIWLRHKLRT